MFLITKSLLILIIYTFYQVHHIQACSCSNQPYTIQFCKSKFSAIVLIRSGPFRLNTGNLSTTLTNHLNHITHRMLQNESSNLLPGIDTSIFYYKAEIQHAFKLNENAKHRNDRKNYIRIWVHHQPGNSCNAKLRINQLYLVWSNYNDENEPRISSFCNAVPFDHIKSNNRELLNRLVATGLRCR